MILLTRVMSSTTCLASASVRGADGVLEPVRLIGRDQAIGPVTHWHGSRLPGAGARRGTRRDFDDNPPLVPADLLVVHVGIFRGYLAGEGFLTVRLEDPAHVRIGRGSLAAQFLDGFRELRDEVAEIGRPGLLLMSSASAAHQRCMISKTAASSSVTSW